jgi:hypothetical protein
MRANKQTTFKKLILDDLKAQKLHVLVEKIKSIRYDSFAGGDSVSVKAVNLTKSQRETLRAILDDYTDGHFDGMYDIYEYKKGDATKPRTAKYVSLDNEFSDDVRNRVIAILHDQWGITDDTTAREKMNCWFDQAVWRLIQDLEDL